MFELHCSKRHCCLPVCFQRLWRRTDTARRKRSRYAGYVANRGCGLQRCLQTLLLGYVQPADAGSSRLQRQHFPSKVGGQPVRGVCSSPHRVALSRRAATVVATSSPPASAGAPALPAVCRSAQVPAAGAARLLEEHPAPPDLREPTRCMRPTTPRLQPSTAPFSSSSRRRRAAAPRWGEASRC